MHLLATVGVALAIVALVVLVRGRSGLVAEASSGAAPGDRMASAALLLEQRTAKGGQGYTFEIVQTTTITAKPGGPKIEVPDPRDRTKSLGFADEYRFYALIERGMVTPEGF